VRICDKRLYVGKRMRFEDICHQFRRSLTKRLGAL